jgi:hypothetical protein
MRFGRLIRVKNRRGDPEATIYVVAEPDVAKAIAIIRITRIRESDDFEDE